MVLTVLVTATDEKLTIRENFKEVIGLSDSKSDNFIDKLINRSSSRIRSYLGRPLALQKYQVVIPSFGGVNLQLPYYPVRDVFRVFDGSDTGFSLELSSTEYRLDKQNGFLNRDDGFKWSRQIERSPGVPSDIVSPGGEYKRWFVEFSAGYILEEGIDTGSSQWSTAGGSTSTGKTLPDDIEDACIESMKTAFLSRSRESGIKSQKVGDVTVTYSDDNSLALPNSVKEILEPYRSV